MGMVLSVGPWAFCMQGKQSTTQPHLQLYNNILSVSSWFKMKEMKASLKSLG